MMKRLLEAVPAIGLIVFVLGVSWWADRVKGRKTKDTFRYRGKEVPKL